MIKHSHVDKRSHVSRDTAGCEVCVPSLLVQQERNAIQAVDDGARHEKSVSPHVPNDQADPNAQEQGCVEEIVDQGDAAASHSPEQGNS